MSVRLLVVDDHTVVRAGIVALLGLEADLLVVAEADDGGDVVRLVAEHAPDVVLMDLRMPGMDGLTAIRHIRAREDGKAELPIIVVTADTGAKLLEECVAQGADDVLFKPVAMQDLFDAMGRILARQASGEAMI